MRLEVGAWVKMWMSGGFLIAAFNAEQYILGQNLKYYISVCNSSHTIGAPALIDVLCIYGRYV